MRMEHPSRRDVLAGSAAVLTAFTWLRGARAQAAPATAGPADPKLVDDLVAANRVLFDQGVVDGYGHVSVRHDKAADHYLMSRSLAPELVTAADIMEYYLERFIHGEIYRVRPDVRAIVHNHSPSVIPFGVTGVPLRPLYHMSAFLWPGVPVFEIRNAGGPATDMLIRDAALGQALARALGASPVVLMRGHGAVAVGGSLPEGVFRAVYTEVNARLQAQAMALGGTVVYLDPEEAKRAQASVAGTTGRPWELWKKKALTR